MNLLKVLLISWLAGAGLSLIKPMDIDYQLKCLVVSVVYLFLAGFCYKYISVELKLSRNLNAYLISLLCVCMIVSCFFNYLFVSSEVYYYLIDIKEGDGLSWKNIYKTVEFVALLMVGKNGFTYIYNWCICRLRRFNAIIANNQTYNIGRNT